MKTTIEQNKMIAEFMGDLTVNHAGDIKEDITKFKYHTSWDWLMPVLNKIITLPNPKPLETTKGTKQREIQAHAGYANIKEVYKCTVEFIKWYNQQSK